jgi:iron complex transport system ATP-binding protein
VTTSAPSLIVSGLTCTFRDGTRPAGGIEALSDVGFQAQAGTLCGVVGPNGAGKTTLLRAIAGLITPARGEITINGRAVLAMTPTERARLLALLPQRPIVPNGITVREAVAWGRTPHLGRLRGSGTRDLEAVDQALDRAGARHLADRSIEGLSGGEYQRAAIARALAQTPSVLLADEPTVHLDLGHQLEIMALLQALARTGLIVIAVLHDLNLAAQYADELIMLHQGRVLASGRAEAVLRPDRIARAYGAKVSIELHPETRRLQIMVGGPAPRTVGHGA